MGGIWYKKIPKRTIVWIANRETPLNTTTGLLKLNSNGSLVILNGSNTIVWSSNSSASVNNPVAQLLDSGNFVIRDETDSSPENFLWQSFNIIGNTFLADIRGSGSGCLLWFNEIIDIREHKENGQDIHIRMAASKLGRPELRLMSIPIVLTVTMMLGIYLCVIRKKRIKHMEVITRQYYKSDRGNRNGEDDLQLPLFDFTALANATNGFSTDSRLGEGGFGPVYKGMLDETKEIAVKRLSKDSTQGLQEFKNEVSCIARLQHGNLVKLLGCSVKEGERMLVYEYMPNKSLDSFIFDKEQSKALDWPRRYNIINGIARELLYLHQDSRMRIIHRDLKASNVLLDNERNPKISDFGTARICGETETGANTTRVVGTYGYMSPEYAIDGKFSVKSDVYNFGVLLLEVVSGKRNKKFTHPDHNLNLLGHAWRIYTNGEVLDIVDEPKEPAFFNERKLYEGDSTSSSSNYLSVTTMAPR
ncbi:putative serine/threonine/dual specificity protein kinase, catalytic domain-containing protein [Heracleum sosnowskyi]|uniref:non-specific serine/threonine protein kinase n=1 Tax=Heracleum sosnowskyi TaxID=360622 RepID=A0AAD8ITS8_9APIA|nr:putative serine/threonine/dual specificity protein kinase, catalytic domain-containing protein [Heracleum sosnowskyi]